MDVPPKSEDHEETPRGIPTAGKFENISSRKLVEGTEASKLLDDGHDDQQAAGPKKKASEGSGRPSTSQNNHPLGPDEPRRASLNLWMGIHRADDTHPTAASIRRQRRISRNQTVDQSQSSGAQDQMMANLSDELKELLANTRMEDLAPGTRVMFLLNDQNEAPSLFTEMGELTRGGAGSVEEWRETARWVKFEEDVEEGGNRWSKPHVATLSLHSLFQLRSCLLHGVVIIDLDADALPDVIESILDEFIRVRDLSEDEREDVRQVLSLRHTHQYEQCRTNASTSNGGGGASSLGAGNAPGMGGGGGSSSGFLSAVRSISDIGRSFSHGRNLAKAATAAQPPSTASGTQLLELPKVGSLPRDLSVPSKEGSQADFNGSRNAHFMKKLPPGVEASNILVGEVDFLDHIVTAFVRLKTASILGDLTEVPIASRFIFLLLGPIGYGRQFKEIGRAIATLMSDEIFHDVAFKARGRADLLDGIDEFLDSVTVLPPGEWDPTIRIEPPTNVPSQQKRVQAQKVLLLERAAASSSPSKNGGGRMNGSGGGGGGKKRISDPDESEAGGHGCDPALRRTGRLFGGLVADIRRKMAWYKSDFTEAFNLQCVATFCFMYFALLAPIVTFGGLLEEATHQRMAAMENLASGALCGIIYHIFSGQPLTIIGSTGPVLVFETIVFDICASLGINYLSFRFWVNAWTAFILFILVATDLSSLVSYITRFTEESFATLIAVIFIYEAIVKLWKIGDQLDVTVYRSSSGYGEGGWCRCVAGHSSPSVERVRELARKMHFADVDSFVPRTSNGSGTSYVDWDAVGLSRCRRMGGELRGDACYVLADKLLMSMVLMVGTFLLATTLKQMRNSRYFPSRIRQVFSDFAVMISIVCMTSLDLFVGINTPKLNVPSTFRPTWEGRRWLIGPFDDGNPWWTVPAALPPALLACILIFMDQQITTVIVNRKENKLKKGCGYHLDLLVLSVLLLLTGLFGLPVYVAATVLSINHVNSLRKESASRAPGEVPHFIGVCEQRVTGTITFLLIGLSVTMTGILGHIPMPVLYGVFLYMGIAALNGIQLFDRLLLLLMPMKYQPDTIYIRHVPISVIHCYTACQVLCLAMLWTVKSIKATSISFPIMLVVMVGVRKGMERFFAEKDLRYLDDPMPDFHLRKREDAKKKRLSHEIEIDLDHQQGTIHAVKTEAHLHIPMTSGNIIKIPLAAIQPEQPADTPPAADQSQQPVTSLNLTKAVNASGMWQFITQSQQQQTPSSTRSVPTAGGAPPSSQSLQQQHSTGVCDKQSNGQSPRLATPEDDEERPITINVTVTKPSITGHHESDNAAEREPLLLPESRNDKNEESSV